MNFVEMITAAYEAEEEQERHNTDIHRKKNEAAIIEDLAEMGITEEFIISEGNIIIFSHGLILRALFEFHDFVYQLEGICKICNQICWSSNRRTLAGIGKMYHNFEPSYQHRCPKSTVSTAPSLEEQLIEALKSLIDSMIPEE